MKQISQSSQQPLITATTQKESESLHKRSSKTKGSKFGGSGWNNYGYTTWKREKLPFVDLSDKHEIKIDWSLYMTLLYKQSPSHSARQKAFAEWLKNWIRININGVGKMHQDKSGNIFVTKGTADLYPCVVAHMDINQTYCPQMRVIKNEKWVWAMDMETCKQVGPGHDDKSGVYLCLEMLRRFDNIKIALFVDEEVGGVGSSSADGKFFADCSMILQQDRNAYKGPELITHTNGIDVCSKEFVLAAKHLTDKYGYTEGDGTFTDVGCLKTKKEVTCVAMNSCAAYYDEHSSYEVLSVPGFTNCVNFAYELIRDLGGVKWEHVSPARNWSYYGFNEDDYLPAARPIITGATKGVPPMKSYYDQVKRTYIFESDPNFSLQDYYRYKFDLAEPTTNIDVSSSLTSRLLDKQNEQKKVTSTIDASNRTFQDEEEDAFDQKNYNGNIDVEDVERESNHQGKDIFLIVDDVEFLARNGDKGIEIYDDMDVFLFTMYSQFMDYSNGNISDEMYEKIEARIELYISYKATKADVL